MRAFVLALCGLAIASACSARMCIVVPPNVEDAKEFIDRFTDALQYFKDAEAKHKGIVNSKDAPEFLSTLKLAQEDFACASKQMSGYDASTSEGVRLATTAVRTAAKDLTDLNDVAAQDFVAELNGQRKNVLPGDRADRMARIQQQSRDAWQSIGQASTAASLSLIQFDPANDRLKRLALSSRERERAAQRLKSVYPAVARKAATPSPVELAVGILYDFLTSKNWRSHDQTYAEGVARPNSVRVVALPA